MIVVGSSNSSNSQRLREVAERSGCKLARLVLRADDVEWELFKDVKSVGITAGASAPEVLVEEIMDAFAQRFELDVEIVSTADESVFFRCRANCGRRTAPAAAAASAAKVRKTRPTIRFRSRKNCANTKFQHDLFGKPAATFPDHALVFARSVNLHTIATEQDALRLFDAIGGEAQLPIDQPAGESLVVHRAQFLPP